MVQQKHDYSKMSLGRLDVFLLFFYYMILLVFGFWFSVQNFYTSYINKNYDLFYLICELIGFSILGSVIYYSRKLYKASINGDYKFDSQYYDVARIGSISFFVFRPLYSVILSFIIFSLWRASINISDPGQVNISLDTYFIIIPMGFFSGFSAGKILEIFEERSVENMPFVRDAKND